ncbi:MAG: hypothetical protein RSE91_01880 [Bacilli bacterium]
MDIFQLIIRGIFGPLDKVFFWLSEMTMSGFFALATQDLFPKEIFAEIKSRLFVIVGIFMLFRLAVSLLQALVNPEKITDKQTGTTKLIGKVIVSLGLLVLLPTIFDKAIAFQLPIAETLPKIILGVSNQVGSSENLDHSEMAKSISFYTYRAFFDKVEGCNNTSLDDATSYGDLWNALFEKCDGDDSQYAYTYIPLAPMFIGAFMAITMLFFCIDIAIRQIKLGILQILAPIPILSYINPKAAKDGAFNNWIKSCVTTYLDLFIKIGVVYLCVFLLTNIPNIFKDKGPFTALMIIVGIYFFMKQAPKFISDILGLKGAGNIMGIGGAMLTGGVGGLITGGGAGMLLGASMAAESANQAAATGKAMDQFPAFMARDRIKQMVTGDKNARGGFMGRLENRSRNKLADQMGLTSDNIKEQKGFVKEKQSAYDVSKGVYEKANADYTAIASQRKAMPIQSNYQRTNSNGVLTVDPSYRKDLQDYTDIESRFVTATATRDAAYSDMTSKNLDLADAQDNLKDAKEALGNTTFKPAKYQATRRGDKFKPREPRTP